MMWSFEGFPKPSDIFMRTLSIHPISNLDPWNSAEAVSNFDVTRLEWVYWKNQAKDRDFISKMNAKVSCFGGSINPTLTIPGLSAWCRTLDGKTATVPWLRVYNNDRTNQCVNNPDTMIAFSNVLAEQLSLGVNAFQFDDVAANFDVMRAAGGCFCDYCVSGFETWLIKNKKLEEYAMAGRGDGSHFDIKGWLISQGVKSGDGTFGDPRFPEAIKKDFEKFQIESVRYFLPRVQELATSIAGRPIPFSKNTKEEWLFDIYNYGMSELNWAETSPRSINENISKYRAVGKTLVFDGPKKYPITETDISFQRTAWVTCIAAGGYAFVPWDMFTAPAKPRQFVEAKNFSDLTGFVRAVAPLLDEYTNILTPWLGEGTGSESFPVSVDKGLVVAFPHKGARSGHAVIHLINWEKSPQNVKVQFEPNGLLGGARRIRVKTWSPAPWSQEAHALASQSGDYRSQAIAETVYEGEVRPLEIKVKEWTILEVEAIPAGKIPAAPRLFPFTGTVFGATTLRAEAEKDAVIYYTLDGSEPSTSSKKLSGSLTISGKDGEVIKVKTRASVDGQLSPVAESHFTTLSFKKASLVSARTEPGVIYDYYEGAYEGWPDWKNLTPVKSGKLEFPHQGLRPIETKDWAAKFKGYLKVSKTGFWKFYGFYSSDKGRLRVKVSDQVVFDTSGGASKTGDGQITLEEGLHPFQVEICEEHVDGSKSGHFFSVGFSGPGVSGERITDKYLSREQ